MIHHSYVTNLQSTPNSFKNKWNKAYNKNIKYDSIMSNLHSWILNEDLKVMLQRIISIFDK